MCRHLRRVLAIMRTRGRRSINIPAGRDPQEQVSPDGLVFSVAARSQVHSPTGRALHEQRGPATAFSEAALLQVQWRADCLPQEQVACWAEEKDGSACKVLVVSLSVMDGLRMILC